MGGETKQMTTFNSPDRPFEETWYVIGEGVEHEFFPVVRDMVVVSFHTCSADELEEVSCVSGASRHYQV